MIESCCVVSKLPTVFLLLAALTGFIQATIHRCLREFDPSNCNALEEVWAFDARGQKCIEMAYGGCGKPQKFSNRFESHEECMQSCGNVAKGLSKLKEREAAEEVKDVEKDNAGDEPQFVLKNRDSGLRRATSRENEVDKVRGVFNVIGRGTNQLQAIVPQTKLLPSGVPGTQSNGRLSQPNQNTMGIDYYNYRIRPHPISLEPIGAVPSPSYALYPLGQNIMYGPVVGNIIQPPMQLRAPMYGQELQWNSSPSQYRRSMYNNIPGTTLTGAYPFLQSMPWLPRYPVKK